MSDPNIPLGPTRPQKLIDDELLKLEKRFIQLKIERNAHAAISRLPDSVMSEIFTILASTSALDSWYRINLVCQHWRDVVLGTVALWTTPPTYHHDLTMLMLERSKMADLSVNLTSKTAHATSSTLLRQVGRIHSLSIEQNLALLDQAMQDVKASKDCPRFRLKKLHVGHFLDEIRPDDPLGLAPPIFNLDVLPIPSLTHLCLDFNVNFICDKISVRRLLSILREMQNLECLKLNADIISEDGSLAQVGLHDVHLPLLHALEISRIALQQHIASLLSHLRLPRLNRLLIQLEHPHSGVVENYSWLMRAAWSTVGRGDFKTSQTLSVSSNSWCTMEPIQQMSHSNPGDVGMEVCFSDHRSALLDSFSADAMATLDDSTILSRIIELEIDQMDDDTDYERLFGRLLNVESITSSWRRMPHLIKALAIIDSNGSPRMFPKLARIVVAPFPPYTHNLEGWYDCLMARHQAGAPIRELSVHDVQEEEKFVLRSFLAAGVEVVKVGTRGRGVEEIRRK